MINPYLKLEYHSFDLGLENREATSDQVLRDSIEALREVKVGVKGPTATVEKPGIAGDADSEIWNDLNGTLVQEPIVLESVPQLIPHWVQPVMIARHGYRGHITEGIASSPGKLSMTYTPDNGSEATTHDIHHFKGRGAFYGEAFEQDQIWNFANTCLGQAYGLNLDLKLGINSDSSPNSTDLYEEIFDDIFD